MCRHRGEGGFRTVTPRLSANPGLAVTQVPVCGWATSPSPLPQLRAANLRSPRELMAPHAQALLSHRSRLREQEEPRSPAPTPST